MRTLALCLSLLCACHSGEENKADEPAGADSIDFNENPNALKYVQVEAAKKAPIRASIIATLSAQIGGTVVERNVLPGQEIRADSPLPLLTVADLTTVWALAEIYEADLSLVDPGDAVEVRVPAYPDEVFKGQVAYVG